MQMQEIGDSTRPLTALFTLVITLIYVILCAAHLTRVRRVALKLMRTWGSAPPLTTSTTSAPRLPLLN